jgi:hypothetical protein
LHPVFLASVPLGVAAFVLSCVLPQLPLRADASPAAAVAESPAAAPAPEAELWHALSRLTLADLRRTGYEKLAVASGLGISGECAWALTRLARGTGVPVQVSQSCVDELLARGYVARAGGGLALSPAGQLAAEQVSATQHSWLRTLLAEWSPQQREELTAILSQLTSA